MHVTVIARPDQASYAVYGRTSIDDELITFDASVTNSWMSLTVSPTDPIFAGAKLTVFAIYGETVNPLETPVPVSYGPGDVGSIGGNTEAGQGGTGGVASNSFRNIAIAGQSLVIADSPTDTLTLAAGSGITLTSNPNTDTITITGVAQSNDTLANITARGAITNDALIINNSVTANDFISNGAGVPAITSPTNLDLSAPGAIRITGGGVLQLPRLSSAQRDALVVASGSLIYNTNLNKLQAYENSSWQPLSSNSFSSIAVSGQANLEADSSSDTLTLVAGPNITITTNAGSDTITISATTGGSSSGVSTGTENRLAYYASTGAVVQDSGAGLTWSGTNLSVAGTVVATGDVSYVRAYFDTLVELQAVSASIWHGMVAHVHENGGRMYFAHGGSWQPMSNFSDLNIFKTIAVSGQTSIVADSATDTLTLVAGTNVTITTDAATDTITINATGGGSAGTLDSLTDVVITGTPATGQVLKYNGVNWINDTDAVSAGTGGGTVTSVTGAGTVNGLTLTGTVTSAGNLTLGGTLSNVNLTSAVTGVLPTNNGGTGTSLPSLVAGSNVTITGTWPNQTINAASGSGSGISYTISASGSSDYVFSGPGIVTGNTNDPVLYLYRGFTYTFINTTGGAHPFAIRLSSGGTAYTAGVSGSQTGTQVFEVPMNAPASLYYQCTIHSGMGNVINIV